MRTGREEDVILLTQGSGHMSLPAGVQVVVQAGFAKCNSGRSATDGSTVIGAGARAPPPSRVAGYAQSSADSGYSGSVAARSNTVDSYRMSPPRDAATFMRGGPAASSYMSAADIPLPRSTVGASSSEWEVVGELDGFQDRARDDCSIAPSDSISSVGNRDNGGFTRRATHNF